MAKEPVGATNFTSIIQSAFNHQSRLYGPPEFAFDANKAWNEIQ